MTDTGGHRDPPNARFRLDELTTAQLQCLMGSGDESAVSLTEGYLERIANLNHLGPALSAVIETNPDALEIAHRLDRERAAGVLRGALHGIPIVVKDNLDTCDGMSTTAGSLALVGSRPRRDAWVIRRLREAGAIVLAKANMSEWANFRSPNSTSGWSARGGQGRNPYVLDRSTSGSSSGSAVAVSANLSPLAIGTETDGSIVSPAAHCCVVGIKPTVGLVSRSGIIPIAHSQDTAGPMARTVTDAALLLDAMVGHEPTDKASLPRASRIQQALASSHRLDGVRIGVAREYFELGHRVAPVMAATLDALTETGATLVDDVVLGPASAYAEDEREVLLYEFKADLNSYLEGLGRSAPIRSLADLIAFNVAHREEELPHFGQELLVMAAEKGPLTDPGYITARHRCLRLARDEGIGAALARHRLDALVAPTAAVPAPIDIVNGDRRMPGSYRPAAVAGYPSITVPAGWVCGLPVGALFFGAAFSEPTLIRIAAAFERLVQARRPPRFLTTVL